MEKERSFPDSKPYKAAVQLTKKLSVWHTCMTSAEEVVNQVCLSALTLKSMPLLPTPRIGGLLMRLRHVFVLRVSPQALVNLGTAKAILALDNPEAADKFEFDASISEQILDRCGSKTSNRGRHKSKKVVLQWFFAQLRAFSIMLGTHMRGCIEGLTSFVGT